MDQYVLSITLDRLFANANLYSYDDKDYLSYLNHFIVRIPPNIDNSNVEDLIGSVFAYIDKNTSINLFDRDLISSDRLKIYFKIPLKEHKVLGRLLSNYGLVVENDTNKVVLQSLMKSCGFDQMLILNQGDFDLRLLSCKIEKDEELKVEEFKKSYTLSSILNNSTQEQRLKKAWLARRDLISDFDLLFNYDLVRPYGFLSVDHIYTRFLIDNYMYEDLLEDRKFLLKREVPLVITGFRNVMDANSIYDLSVFLSSVDISGEYDLYYDRSNSIGDLLSLDLKKGAYPSPNILERGSTKLACITLDDPKEKYGPGDTLGSIDIERLKEMVPYKDSLWGIIFKNYLGNVHVELEKGVKIGNSRKKKFDIPIDKTYKGLIIDTTHRLPDEPDDLINWYNNLLQHFEKV